MTGRTAEASDRTAFMARVSRALGHSGELSSPPRPLESDLSIARLATPSDNLLSMFADKATTAGMSVHKATSSEAIGVTLSILASVAARRVALSAGQGFAEMAAAFQSHGIELVQTKAGFEPLFTADTGVTDVQAAIAETGSLVCRSGPDRSRGTSLVPPIHIAIVRRSDIIPDLLDLFSRPLGQSSNMVLITGPSKTADIEGILITGVHGPRQVHIVLVEDA
jgi:L-lactate dehydrogenase complex protein LldG